MKEFFKKIKVLDIIILSFIVSIVFISSFFIYSTSDSTLYLKIKTPNEEFIYPLNKDKDIRVQGYKGISHIKIEQGKAFMVNSTCPNKTCVNAKKLKQVGDWNACLPNKVFLTIEAKK